MDEDNKKPLESNLNAITDLLDTMQDINTLSDRLNSVLQNVQQNNTSYSENADKAKQSLNAAKSELDGMIEGLLNGLNSTPQEAEQQPQAKEKKQYQTALINNAFFKKEGKYSYLFEFPRAVTNAKETCVWIPKSFCTKKKDNIEVRFYPNTKFYFFQNKEPNRKETVSAETFQGYLIAADTFLQIQGQQRFESKQSGGVSPPEQQVSGNADFLDEQIEQAQPKEQGDQDMIGYTYEKTVQALKTQTKENVKSAEAWMKYLDTQARFSMLRYSDVALIMEQMPNATEVHSYRHWNSMGYYVRKGQKGLDFLNHKDPNMHYKESGFDITQVSPKRFGKVQPIHRWELKEEYRQPILDYLKDTYQLNPDLTKLEYALSDLAQSSGMDQALDTDKDLRLLKNNIGEYEAHKLIADSAEYILAKRCGLNPDFTDRFANITALNNDNAVELASAVGNAARIAITEFQVEIGRQIPAIERSAIARHKQQETKEERASFNDASYSLAKDIFEFERQYDTDFEKKNTAFDEIFGYVRTGKVAGLKMNFADLLAKNEEPVSSRAGELIKSIDTFINTYADDLIKVEDGAEEHQKPALDMPVIRSKELVNFLQTNIWKDDSIYHNAKLVMAWAMNDSYATDQEIQQTIKEAYTAASDKRYQLNNGSSIADIIDDGIAVASGADEADVTLFSWPEIQTAIKERVADNTYLNADEAKALQGDLNRLHDEGSIRFYDVVSADDVNVFSWFNMHAANETITIPVTPEPAEETKKPAKIEKISLFNNLGDMPTEADLKNADNEEPKAEAPALAITDDDLVSFLKSGSGFEGGKYRIQELYSSNTEKKSRIEALKNEYGTGGRSWNLLNGSDCSADYDSKGIRFSVFHTGIQRSFSWTQADRELERLVKANEYLADDEKADYYLSSEISFDKQVDNALEDKNKPYGSLLVLEHTPELLQQIGCDDLPMFYTQQHLLAAVGTHEGTNHNHGISVDAIKKMPEMLQNPVVIYDSLSKRDSLVVVTNEIVDNRPLVIAVRKSGSAVYQSKEYASNFVLSIYPHENIVSQLQRAGDQNKLLFVDKEKSQRLAGDLGVQFPACLSNLASTGIIHPSLNISKNAAFDSDKPDLRNFLINYTNRIMPDGADQFAVYELYTKDETTEEERIQEISQQYHTDNPRSNNIIPLTDELSVQTNNDGVIFWNPDNSKLISYYSWHTVDQMLDRLVHDGEYLDNDEVDYFNNENRKEAEAAQTQPNADQINDDQHHDPEYVFHPKYDHDTDKDGVHGVVISSHDAGEGVRYTLLLDDGTFIRDIHEEELEEYRPEAEVISEPENQAVASGGETPPEQEEAKQPSSPENPNPINYHPESAAADFSFSPKTKFNDNINAIKTLKQIEAEGRFATADEQAVLAKYVGWGGLANAFDSTKQDWQNEYQQLKDVLTPAEYSSAAGSTTTAFYTNPVITHAIMEKMESMGFSHGNLLEPGCGTGNFLGAIPEDKEDQIKAYGVEMDSISGRIAKQLYQKANIGIERLQDSKLPDNMFDAAVGNVPFEEVRIRDTKHGNQHFLLHDYMIARSIDMLRPNGIAALITSSGTMDKKSEDFRLWLSRKADLIGAVRLPASAFKSAGTSVTTDILFFQKRETPAVEVPEWVHSVSGVDLVIPKEMQDKADALGKEKDELYRDYEALCNNYVAYNVRNEKWTEYFKANSAYEDTLGEIEKFRTDHSGLTINKYFLSHPEMLAGNVEIGTNQFGKEVLVIKDKEDTSLQDALSEAFKQFNAEITYTARTEEGQSEEVSEETLPVTENIPDNAFTLVDGKIYQRQESQLIPVQGLEEADRNRISGMIALRTAMDNVLDANRNHNDDAYLQGKQKVLNEAYDSFIAENGYINSRANKKVFSADPSYYRLCSLEKVNDKQDVIGKADIFTKRTIRYAKIITEAENAVDALNASIAEKGSVDFAYMQVLTGRTEDELKDDLQGQIFLDPDDNEYKPADEYLFGNVRRKLMIAERMVEEGHTEYNANVEYLKEAQPEDIPASDISVPLGATWVPEKYINEFMYETFNTPYSHRLTEGYTSSSDIFATYSSAGGAGGWNITGKALDGYNPRVTSTYGTEYTHANAYWLLEDCLNLRQRVIKEKDFNGNLIVNQEATADAQAKQDAIKDKWSDWVFKDPQRRDELTKRYNALFNHDRLREFDGSHIQFRGMNPDIELRPHQKDAVAHIIRGGNTLLAHTVGAGKTYEMIAAAMELKRLGKCTKSMIVVPKHLTEQWGHDFMKLYPGANILVATEKDFTPERRKKFCTQIATGNYDAVILGYTQFMKIPLSIERQEANLKSQIDEISNEILTENDKSWGFKQLVKFRHSLEEKLEELSKTKKDENVIDFESLGIDHLFVDEAHNFKNLYVITKLSRVAGISTTSSQQAFDMYSKCRYLDEITNYQGVTFATGTPISNSMTELYTMMRYLQADRLKEMHMSLFDEWATTFGEITHEAELSPEGSSFRMKDRMAHFVNVPELMTVFREAADIQTSDMLNLDVPDAEFIKVDVPISEAQKEYIQELGDRADKVKSRQVDVTVDNMLKITTDGRKAALDMRCIDPAFPEANPSKVSMCADKIYEMYESSNEIKGTQMVFCDQSTPSMKDADKYSIYTDLKAKLIEKGIPAEQIAFIHEANTAKEKDALFAKVRSGEIRVLIGSTVKMGTGTNAQDRMVALHHLDVPWRPSDLEQREGRIIRQGNMNQNVKIFRYITKDTFDAYSWQLIEQKQRFASQIMTSKNPARTVDDVDEAVMSYAEVKAACIGNPEIKEQIDLKYEVTKLKAQKKAFLNNIYTLQDKIRKDLPQQIKVLENRIAKNADDAKEAEKIMGWNADDFSLEINGQQYKTNKDAGTALMETAKKSAWQQKDTRVPIGKIGGFEIQAEYSTANNILSVILHGNLGHSFTLGDDAVGNMARLRFALKGIADDQTTCKARLAQLNDQLETAKKDVENAAFPKEDELKQKSERLAELNAKYAVNGGASLNKDNSQESVSIEQKDNGGFFDDGSENRSGGGITM